MRCYRHPDRAAVGSCVRCGNLICDVCDVIAGGRHYCKTCLERMGPEQPFGVRRFVRTKQDRVLAGVCGGIARYFGVDSSLVRVIYSLAAFFTAIIPFTIAYLVLAIVAPEEE